MGLSKIQKAIVLLVMLSIVRSNRYEQPIYSVFWQETGTIHFSYFEHTAAVKYDSR